MVGKFVVLRFGMAQRVFSQCPESLRIRSECSEITFGQVNFLWNFSKFLMNFSEFFKKFSKFFGIFQEFFKKILMEFCFFFSPLALTIGHAFCAKKVCLDNRGQKGYEQLIWFHANKGLKCYPKVSQKFSDLEVKKFQIWKIFYSKMEKFFYFWRKICSFCQTNGFWMDFWSFGLTGRQAARVRSP